MTQRVLISGSVAYDTIMVFEGRFQDHILPDRVHMLNVSFLAPRMKREFGGCAANIAYTLAGLGGAPVVLGTVGRDADDYLQRLRALGVDTTQMLKLDEHFTAQAFITTDLADNQISAFHPGAMSDGHLVHAVDALPARMGIVAPNGKQAMVTHARAFRDAGLPFIFDPGQGLPMFDGDELRALITSATAVTVNDYEAGMLAERTGWSEEEIARRVQALVVTLGAEGAQVWVDGERNTVAPCPARQTIDPTGCGDAFRGGLLYGLAQDWSWLDAARLGSVMGALKIEHAGAQNHPIDREDVAQRYAAIYGRRPW